jgi:hypothetical protein
MPTEDDILGIASAMRRVYGAQAAGLMDRRAEHLVRDGALVTAELWRRVARALRSNDLLEPEQAR